jgi:serine/threonine protein kinase
MKDQLPEVKKASSPKILGEGTYGCVISPSIECIPSKPKYDYVTSYAGDKVSKIFIDVEDYKKEMEINIKIHKLDPESKYFITPIQACTAKIDTIPITKNCKMIANKNTKPSNVNQLIMPHAGKDMYAYIETLPNNKISLTEWISLLGNIIEGITVLRDNKMCHCDIKPANMMYNNVALRLIDFGLTATFRNLYKDDEGFWPYLFYPPELYVADFFLVNFMKARFNKVFEDKITAIIGDTKDIKDIKKIFKKYYFDKDTVKDDLEIYFRREGRSKSRETLRKPENIEKIDIFSLGMSCVFLHSYIDFTTVPEEINNLYIDFVKKITDFDFRTRLSVDDTSKMYYEQLLPSIKKSGGALKKSK